MARVGRDTKRKLGSNDRLIGALKLSVKNGIPCRFLCIGIAAAMFFAPEGDDSSKELCAYAEENGVKAALEKYSEYTGEYADLTEKLYGMLKEGKKISYLINYCDALSGAEVRV